MTARKFLEARSIDSRHDDPICLYGKREGREGIDGKRASNDLDLWGCQIRK